MRKIFFLVPFCCLSVYSFGQKLSAAEAKKDLELFNTALVEAHPGMYRFESKETMDSLFQGIENSLTDSIGRQAFYQLLSPLVASIHCGHTKFHPEGLLDEDHLYHYFYGTDRLFPLRLFFSGKSAYCLDSYDMEMDFERGTELISINGRPLAEIIPFLLKNIPADGRVESYKYLELNNYFPAFYANLLESPEQFHLSLKKKNGELFTSILPATSLAKIQEYERHNTRGSEPTFHLSYPGEGVAVMRIKAFYPLQKGDHYKKFLKRSFTEIQSKDIQRLVIDLRNNEGGNDRWGAMLFAYLTREPFAYYDALRLPNKDYSFTDHARMPKFYGILKLFIKKDRIDGGYLWTRHKNLKTQHPRKDPFTGDVNVLINGYSFSVTAEFASVAKSAGRVKFIGQETGGAYSGNNSGTFTIVTLPNSRLVLGIPMVGYYMSVSDIQAADRGVLPDMEIKPELEQCLSGEDLILETALR